MKIWMGILLGATAAFVIATVLMHADAPAAPAAADATAGECSQYDVDAVADQCLTCHVGGLSLKGRDAAEVSAIIRAMADGDVPHPVPVPELSDAGVDALARQLTCD